MLKVGNLEKAEKYKNVYKMYFTQIYKSSLLYLTWEL